MTQEYVIQRKGAVISEGENSFVPEEGLRAAEYRLIGNTPDAKASVILLCESRNPSQWAGTCKYQGKTYLALSVGSDSTMTLFFTGLHSGDCLFSIVNLDDVSWNE